MVMVSSVYGNVSSWWWFTVVCGVWCDLTWGSPPPPAHPGQRPRPLSCGYPPRWCPPHGRWPWPWWGGHPSPWSPETAHSVSVTGDAHLHTLSLPQSLSLSCLSVSVCLSVCLCVSLSFMKYLPLFSSWSSPPPPNLMFAYMIVGVCDVLWFWLGVYNASSLSFQSC